MKNVVTAERINFITEKFCANEELSLLQLLSLLERGVVESRQVKYKSYLSDSNGELSETTRFQRTGFELYSIPPQSALSQAIQSMCDQEVDSQARRRMREGVIPFCHEWAVDNIPVCKRAIGVEATERLNVGSQDISHYSGDYSASAMNNSFLPSLNSSPSTSPCSASGGGSESKCASPTTSLSRSRAYSTIIPLDTVVRHSDLIPTLRPSTWRTSISTSETCDSCSPISRRRGSRVSSSTLAH
jgi:hypothetical protein